jgi:hypothetical protein
MGSENWTAQKYAGGLWLIFTSETISGQYQYYRTEDAGDTWTRHSYGAALVYSCVWFEGYFYRTRSFSVERSSDGISWSVVLTGINTLLYLRVVRGVGLTCSIATSAGPAGEYYSVDGVAWLYVNAGLDHGKAIAANGFGVSSIQLSRPASGFIYTASAWVSTGLRVLSPTTVQEPVYWSPLLGKFVATGTASGGTLYDSSDGVTWTARKTGCRLHYLTDDGVWLHALVYSGGAYAYWTGTSLATLAPVHGGGISTSYEFQGAYSGDVMLTAAAYLSIPTFGLWVLSATGVEFKTITVEGSPQRSSYYTAIAGKWL